MFLLYKNRPGFLLVGFQIIVNGHEILGYLLRYSRSAGSSSSFFDRIRFKIQVNSENIQLTAPPPLAYTTHLSYQSTSHRPLQYRAEQFQSRRLESKYRHFQLGIERLFNSRSASYSLKLCKWCPQSCLIPFFYQPFLPCFSVLWFTG